MTSSDAYLKGVRAWPPITPQSKRVITQFVLRGTQFKPSKGSRRRDSRQEEIVRPQISELMKSGCLVLVQSDLPGGQPHLDVTPSGLVQALCAGDRAWKESAAMLMHLRSKLPSLSGNWATISRASRGAARRLFANAIRLTISSQDWFTGTAWGAFERNYVLALIRSVDITEDQRQRIVTAARNDPSTKTYFLRTSRQLVRHNLITSQEGRRFILSLTAKRKVERRPGFSPLFPQSKGGVRPR